MLGAAQKSPEAFRTISEVAEELDVPQHVLRFWETRFVAVKPLKRGGGRRYYRPEDVDLLRGIRALLYGDGLTIKGVQKVLRQHGVRYVMELGKRARSHLENLNGGVPENFGRGPESIPSNVHIFPKAASAPLFERLASGDWGKEFEGDFEGDFAGGLGGDFSGGMQHQKMAARRLTGEQRARLHDVLDELLEMKARLRAARPKPPGQW